jgi:hypothetical protein
MRNMDSSSLAVRRGNDGAIGIERFEVEIDGWCL